jgi:glycosyltransferase involved in cell wall biosynthesis
MKKPTKVTALVPAYQAAAFIQPTLDSLSAQTRDHFDVLISVDLCDDDTYSVCRKHCERDTRFRVVRQERRLGYVGNCNFLLGQADSDYVHFAFHDDTLEPTYVEKLCAVLDSRPEVVMSYSDLLLTAVDGSRTHCAYTELDGLRDRVERGKKMLLRAGHWWAPNRGIFRLREAGRIQGLKTNGAGEFSADWPWLFHMSLLGEFARVPEILCLKFYKPGSLSKSWAFSDRQNYEVSAACMRELWDSELSSDEKLELGVPLINWLAQVHSKLKRESAGYSQPYQAATVRMETNGQKIAVPGQINSASHPWRLF